MSVTEYSYDFLDLSAVIANGTHTHVNANKNANRFKFLKRKTSKERRHRQTETEQRTRKKRGKDKSLKEKYTNRLETLTKALTMGVFILRWARANKRYRGILTTTSSH